MASTPLHNAEQGFNDIKALPDFNPSYTSELIFAFILLILVLIAQRIYKNLRRNDFQTPVATIDTYQLAIDELRKLASQEFSTNQEFRRLIAEISLSYRRALSELLSLSAAEMTTNELEEEIPKRFDSQDIQLEETAKNQLKRSTLSLLRSFEKHTYGLYSQVESQNLLAEKAHAALGLLDEIKHCLKPVGLEQDENSGGINAV